MSNVKQQVNLSVATVQKFNSELVNFDDQQVIATLQKTVAKNTTVEEFAIFVGFCKATGLNPLKREVWCVKGDWNGAEMQLMTGINGYWSIANSHAEFDGMEGPFFEYEEDGKTLKSCTVKIWRKDKRFPFVGFAKYSEVKGADKTKNGKDSVWGQRPHQMLQKCAEAFALRKAFSQQLNGLIVEEEGAQIMQEHEDIEQTKKFIEIVSTHTYALGKGLYSSKEDVRARALKLEQWLIDQGGVLKDEVLKVYESNRRIVIGSLPLEQARPEIVELIQSSDELYEYEVRVAELLAAKEVK